MKLQSHVTNSFIRMSTLQCSRYCTALDLLHLRQLFDYPYIQVYYSVATAATLMCVAFYSTVHFTITEFLWGVLGASNRTVLNKYRYCAHWSLLFLLSGLWVISQLLAFIAINTIGWGFLSAIYCYILILQFGLCV